MCNIVEDRNQILIIGESLSGLSTAIGLAQAGLVTTVVRKRAQYTRQAGIFINQDRLDFLIKLGVFQRDEIPSFSLDNKKRSILPIREIEENLCRRAHQLGIKMIFGEFKGFPRPHKALINTADGREIQVPFSYIVGADGAKSTVRQALNIQFRKISGPTKAASVFIASQAGTPVIEEIEKETFFLRRVSTPYGKFILLHNTTGIGAADQNSIIGSLRDCAFNSEADAIKDDKSFNIADVTVQLQQADTFSDTQHHALLVGDAAVTGSFFLGRGGNLALKSAEIAVQFFEKLKEVTAKEAYDWFNQQMQQITNELIAGNKYLFKKLLKS